MRGMYKTPAVSFPPTSAMIIVVSPSASTKTSATVSAVP